MSLKIHHFGWFWPKWSIPNLVMPARILLLTSRLRVTPASWWRFLCQLQTSFSHCAGEILLPLRMCLCHHPSICLGPLLNLWRRNLRLVWFCGNRLHCNTVRCHRSHRLKTYLHLVVCVFHLLLVHACHILNFLLVDLGTLSLLLTAHSLELLETLHYICLIWSNLLMFDRCYLVLR